MYKQKFTYNRVSSEANDSLPMPTQQIKPNEQLLPSQQQHLQSKLKEFQSQQLPSQQVPPQNYYAKQQGKKQSAPKNNTNSIAIDNASIYLPANMNLQPEPTQQQKKPQLASHETPYSNPWHLQPVSYPVEQPPESLFQSFPHLANPIVPKQQACLPKNSFGYEDTTEIERQRQQQQLGWTNQQQKLFEQQSHLLQQSQQYYALSPPSAPVMHNSVPKKQYQHQDPTGYGGGCPNPTLRDFSAMIDTLRRELIAERAHVSYSRLIDRICRHYGVTKFVDIFSDRTQPYNIKPLAGMCNYLVVCLFHFIGFFVSCFVFES
jgi:hypothetical protein